jgi:hypothetical protein
MNIRCSVENIQIPDGNSTEEIWDIFETIFNLLEDGDELIFDITHGFRTLPMLNMVLINYAKLLKKISVSGIYYGAFAAGNKTITQIWNLIDFVNLQDWTNASQMFLQAGSSNQLSKLLEQSNVNDASSLRDFTDEILTSRCIAINEGKSAIKTANLFNSAQDNLHPAFKPLTNLVKSKFENYKENEILNGLNAIEWCIDHDLFSQGITIMYELIITFILSKINEDYKILLHRNTVSGRLSISKSEKFHFSDVEENKKIEINIIEKVDKFNGFKMLKDRYISLSEVRNDLNHGGYRKNPENHSFFKNALQDKYSKLKDVINQISNAPQSL